MRKHFLLAAAIGMISALLLAACGNTGDEKLPVSDAAYADYAGYQFSGQDPWGGELTVTVRSIVSGKMDWTFTDTFEDHTLYQEQSGDPIREGNVEYRIEGKDVEHENISFSYEGSMELRDGQILFRFLKGAVSSAAAEGGSESRAAEALKDSGMQNEVVLKKTADDSLTSYTVKEGDSIHSIAKEFGLSTKELAIINQTVIIETAQAHGHQFDDVIQYAEYLFPGEVLLVPRK